jgi:hypothetical protein
VYILNFTYSKDLEVNLKKDYNNRMKSQFGGKDLLSGQEWYEAQAYRGKEYIY